MPGYVIGQLKEITNADGFGAYQGAAGPTVVQYGGKMNWVSTGVESGDGDWSPMGVILFEFESSEQARK